MGQKQVLINGCKLKGQKWVLINGQNQVVN